MRILHLPSTFWPGNTGGKEVFVYHLIKSLPEHEHRVLIHEGDKVSEYTYDDIRVHVLPMPETSDARRSYFDLTFNKITGFDDLLDNYKPDIVHFHDFGGSASLSHLRICKSKGVRTVLTYHSPGQSCLQRALIYGGQQPCNGKIDINICTKCRYLVAGLPEIGATLMSRIRQPFSALDRFFQRANTKMYHDSWHEFHNSIDIIQVHARWVIDLFAINNIPQNKIRFVEMGGHESLPATSRESNDPLRFVFVGRCTDIKGVHLFVEAVLSMPDKPLEVHFFGPYWDDDYGLRLKQKIGNDNRFFAPRLVDRDKVVGELKSMDICVIPSLWPETGPFTVFDAFAGRVVVLGTRHAGIRERTRECVDSVLFNWNDVNDLREKILMLINDRGLVNKLRANIRNNRIFSDFGKGVGELYKSTMK